MYCNQPNSNKFVHISEQTAKPIQVPVVFGNECFVVTQQDFRKIEDTRVLSYSKLLPDGSLVPMDLTANDAAIADAIVCAANAQVALGNSLNTSLEQVLRACCPSNAIAPPSAPVIASLQEQMEWAGSCSNNDSIAFLFTHPKSTSTTEINHCKPKRKYVCFADECEARILKSRGINTEQVIESKPESEAGEMNAQEKLKQQKINASILE